MDFLTKSTSCSCENKNITYDSTLPSLDDYLPNNIIVKHLDLTDNSINNTYNTYNSK